MKCEECDTECKLCPADWIFQSEFWLCPVCDWIYEVKNDESTFVKSEDAP